MPATFVMIPAAGDSAWSWHLVEAELRQRGHEVVAVELPEDESASLWDYADTAAEAIGDRTNVVVVGHSFGGFTAPLVCARAPVDMLVMVSAMIASPGEPPADWWGNTGHEQARREQGGDGDDIATYYHDVPPNLAAEAMKRARNQPSNRAYSEPWPLAAWPTVPTRFLLCRDDRFFPAGWMRGVVADRLGIVPDEMDSGHCPMLGHPAELARRLDAYAAEGRAAPR